MRSQAEDPLEDIWDETPEKEAERLRQEIVDNEPGYRDDPSPDVLVDENREAPNGMFGDHQDDFDIG